MSMTIAMKELESVTGGVLTESDKATFRSYIAFFKKHNYSLKETQMYWVQHMHNQHITSMTEEEAKDYIASIW